MRMIEPVQVKIIHTAVAKLGLSDDDYRTILQGQFKRASCKELTYVEASRLLDYFKTLGFKITRVRVTSGTRLNPPNPPLQRGAKGGLPANVHVLPTRDQLDMIDALAGKIAWRVEGGFKLWMKKYLRIERIKSLEDAQRAIEGLKGMLAHRGGVKWDIG